MASCCSRRAASSRLARCCASGAGSRWWRCGPSAPTAPSPSLALRRRAHLRRHRTCATIRSWVGHCRAALPMRDTFRLGRISGVAIGVNWTLLAVAGLVTVGLAGGRYPAEAPGYSKTAYTIAGLVTAVLFLATVLAHELSHALVAKREGMEVTGVTLWLLGGVTQIEGEAANPAAEVRISGSGPLASLLLGLAFVGVAGLLHLADV